MSTISWAVDADGNWATAANWSPARAPAAADDVTINTKDLHTVTHNAGTDTVHSLRVGNDDFVMSGGALTITSAASFAHLLTVSGGTLAFSAGNASVGAFAQSTSTVSGTGTLTLAGAAAFTGTTLGTGSGTTLLKGATTVGAGDLCLDGGRILENQGTLTLTGGQINVGYNPFATTLGGGTLKNDAGATFDIQAGVNIFKNNGAVGFTNAGLLEQTVTAGVTTIYVPFTNTGKVQVQSGTLAFNGLGSSKASELTVGSGATLDFAGGVFSLDVGAVTGAGKVSVTGGTLAIVSNATVASAFAQSTSIVSGTGTLTLAGAAAFTGTTLGTGSGTTLLKGATTVGAGDLCLDGGRILENQGTLTLTGGQINVGYNPFATTLGGGTLKNDAGATFDIQAGVNIFKNNGAVGFTNAGLLEQTVTAGVTTIYVPFTNTGKVSVQSGTLAFNGLGSSKASALTVGSGATLDFAGGVFSLDVGAVTGAGKVSVTGGTLAIVSNATVASAFAQSTSIVSGTGTLTLAGAAAFTGTTLGTGSGTTLLKGATTVGAGDLCLDGGRILENQGTLTLTGGQINVGYNPFATTLGGGTLKNDAGATFDIQAGVNIFKNNGAVGFTNAGLLEQTVTAGVTTIYVPFTNTGKVQVQSGTLAFNGLGSSKASALTVGSGATLDFAGGVFSLDVGAVTGAGKVSVTGGTLAIVSNATVASAFAQSTSIVSGTGTLTLAGAAAFTGTTLGTGSGTTLLKGATTVGAGDLCLDGGRILENQGTLTLTGGQINVGYNPFATTLGGGTLKNDAGATFDIQAGVNIFKNNGAVGFTNAGLLEQTVTAGVTTIYVPFTNTGKVSVQSGTLALSGGLTNLSGTTLTGGAYEADAGSTLEVNQKSAIVTDAATITLSGAGSAIETFDTASSKEVAIDATLTTIDASGTLEILAGRDWTSTNAISNAGTLDLGGGIFTVASLVSTGLITGFGRIATAVTNSGTISVQAGQALSLVGGSLTNLSGATLTGGTYIVGAGGTLQLANNSSIVTLDATIDLAGVASTVRSLDTASGKQVGLEATLTTIGATGVLESMGGRGYATANALGNSGAIELGGGTLASGKLTDAAGSRLTGFGTVASVFSDAGTVTAAGGALIFTGGGDSYAGALGGVEIDFTGGTDALNAGTSVSAARWSISKGAAVSLNASIAYAGILSQASGTKLSIAAGDALTLTGSGSTLAGSVTGAGTLALKGGAQALMSGATMSVSTWTTSGGDGVTVDESLNYGGAFSLGAGTSLSVASGDTLTMNGGSTFAGQVKGGGTLAFAGGTDALNAGARLVIANWSLSGAVTATLNEVLSYGGALAEGVGSTLALGAHTLTLTGTGSTLAGSMTGAGALVFAGGTQTLNSGASLGVANWSVSSGAVTTVKATLAFAGRFTLSGATLTLGSALTLSGPAGFTSAEVNGSSTLVSKGATSLAGLTLGGGAAWSNGGTATQSAATTLGDSVAGAVHVTNQASGVWNIAGNTGVGLAGSGGTIVNDGLFEKTGGSGTSLIAPGFTNAGTIAVASGILELAGAVSGAGSATISGGALRLDSTFSENVSFTGASGVLDLARSQTYSGTISGFSHSGGTQIDLRDINFASLKTPSFSGNASGGVLTVTDGTHTAHIRLSGDYTTSTFVGVTDGHGGVLIHDPTSSGPAPTTPPARQRQFIAAMAGFGATGDGTAQVAADSPAPGHLPLVSPRPHAWA